MNSFFHRVLKTTALGLTLGAQAFLPAQAYEDILDTPSMMSELADEYLLLDVESLGNRLVAVGARGHIIYSDDRGANWTQAEVPVSVLLTAVDFVNDRTGWAVGHSGVILKSTDAGETWRKQFDGNAANASIISQAEAYLEQLEVELASATEDQAADLEYAVEDAQYAVEDAQLDAEIGAAKPFLDVKFINENQGFAVGAYGFLFATRDGGATWQNYGNRLDNLDRFHLNTIEQLAGGTLLIAGEAGVMFVSRDDGNSWDVLDSPYDGSFFGVLALYEDDHALAFGLRGNLFRTEDGGDSWKTLDSGTESTLMSAAFDGNRKVSITGNGGVVLLSDDGGKNFEAFIREDRLGYTDLTYVTRQRLALIGEAGVRLVSPTGKNL